MDIKHSTGKLFGAKIGSVTIQFFGITYFARELGPTSMGVFFLFEALLGMATIPADFGIKGAVEKRISEGDSPGQFLSSGLLLKTAIIFPVCILIYIFRVQINSYLGSSLSILLIVAIVIQEAATLSIHVLRGELRVEETAILNFSRRAIWIIIGAIFVSFGFDTLGLVYGLIAGSGIVVIWGWFRVSILLGKPSLEKIKSLANYGKYDMTSSIGGYFYSWMDIAVIGFFLSQSYVGTYEIAWRVATVTILFSRVIGQVAFPQISLWDKKGNINKIESLLHNLLTPSLSIVIPAFFGTVLLSNEILGYIFGPEYTSASIVLIILVFNQVSEGAQSIIGQALKAVDRVDFAARATIIGVILNLSLNVVLVPVFGIIGAAVSTTISSIISGLMLHTFYLSRVITIRVPYREIIICILSSVSMVTVLAILKYYKQIQSIFDLLLFVFTGATLYTIFMLLSPRIRNRLTKQLQ